MTRDAHAAHVAVVGGGISGIAATERLMRAGVRVTLLEAGDRLGGVIQSTRADGFVIEHGPDALLAAKPAAVELCERLGIANRLCGTTPGVRGAYVVRGSRLRPLPEGMSGMVPVRLSALLASRVLSPAGMLRAGIEPFIPARTHGGDESVAAFVTRRFGRELSRRLVEPLLAGIYAGDADRLGILGTFPVLREMERESGSVVRGLRRRAPSARTGPAFLSMPGGLAEIVEAAQRAFERSPQVEIRLGARVEGVALGPRVLARLADGSSVEADGVVMATPAHAASRLLAASAPALSDELGAIEHASVAIVTLAYGARDIPRELDATGYVVPRIEGREALACTWSSSKWQGRAPAGSVLLRIFLGGDGRREIVTRPDDALLAIARDEVARTLDARAEPVLMRVTRWLDATPQYTVGHVERVARIEHLAGEHPSLALAGNAYRGVGIPDCIRSGERAADALLENGLSFRDGARSGTLPVGSLATSPVSSRTT